MKILDVAPGYGSPRGYGVARALSALLPELGRLGHEVTVLGGRNENALGGSSEDHVRLAAPEEEYPFFAYSDTLQAVLEKLPMTDRLAELWEREDGFSLVVAHDWSAALSASFAKRVYRVPYVLFLHGTQVGRMEGKGTSEEIYVAEMERWAAEQADLVLLPSRAVQAEAEKHYRVPREKTGVLPDAVGTQTFQAEVDLGDFREMFAPPDEKLVLFAGRLAREKGPDVLLSAIPTILRECPKTRFVFAGEGPLVEPLREDVERRGLKERVQLAGHLGGVVVGALYQAADLLVLPSRYEALGIAALEGALHDLSTVATRCQGLRELATSIPEFLHPKAEPGDPGSLARAVVEGLRGREKSNRNPKPKKERVPDEFLPGHAARVFEGLVESLLANARLPAST
jgi:glycosyltransferase involved in cell wall biosynthesis